MSKFPHETTSDLIPAAPSRLVRIADASDQAAAMRELTTGIAVRLPDGSAWYSPSDMIAAVPARFVTVSDPGEH